MSYAVYTTKGFIISQDPSGEASKLYTIYTEDFGLIRAKAQSVRMINSKLRYHLEPYLLTSLSLVRGKEFWRITGSAVEDTIHKISLEEKKKHMQFRARVLSMIRRLVHGEEVHAELFSALTRMVYRDTERYESPEKEEIVLVAHILALLGYLDMSLLHNKNEREYVQAINKALKESQL